MAVAIRLMIFASNFRIKPEFDFPSRFLARQLHT
jgi:hypothetical protein